MKNYFASPELVKHCQKIIKDPDVIMDLYDQSFAWASDKATQILGFHPDELANTRFLDLRVKDKSDTEDLKEHIAEKDYIADFPMRTKDGKVININARVIYTEFEKDPYQIVKVLKITPLKNKK